jgi:hypothetical protein
MQGDLSAMHESCAMHESYVLYELFEVMVHIRSCRGCYTLDAEVPLRSYGIVTEQARLVKTVKVIFGLAL